MEGKEGEGKLERETLPLFGSVEVKGRERELKDFHSLQIGKKWTKCEIKSVNFKFSRKSFRHNQTT